MLKFNISPSAINLYNTSPLQFYYRYVVKQKPDTGVVSSYGEAGSLVHKCIERFCSGLEYEQYFFDMWNKLNIDEMIGINGDFLNQTKYFVALFNAIEIINNDYQIIKTEETISFPFIDNKGAKINVKGIIDFRGISKNDNSMVIADWKTSTSVECNRIQMKHYAYLIWRKYKIIPRAAVYYIKAGGCNDYVFTREEIMDYDRKLLDFAEMIISKGDDIKQYDIGNIKTPFNVHLNACIKEQESRKNGKDEQK